MWRRAAIPDRPPRPETKCWHLPPVPEMARSPLREGSPPPVALALAAVPAVGDTCPEMWPLFLTFLAACAVAAASGALFRPGDWYESLSKPAWTPPNWLFPVVWSCLYVAMSLAAARVGSLPGTSLALALWTLQIALNTLWSGVFFGLRRMAAAGVLLAALWLAVAATAAAFWQHDRIAGALLAPYLVWVSIALALNWSVWARNREAA